jgi:hypothetical protein
MLFFWDASLHLFILISLCYFLFSANYFFLPFLFADPEAPLFASLSSLLAILRRRDDRRSFCSPNHWLVREVNVAGKKCLIFCEI